MMKIIFTAILCIAGFGSQTALAEDALVTYFGAKNACYARQYSAEHMQNHPDQTISYIRFEHYIETHDAAEFKLEDGEVIFDLVVQFRDSQRKFGDTGTCLSDGEMLKCAIACDGGQFDIKRKDISSILFYNHDRIRVTDCGDDENFREITSETDDKVFLLHRLPAEQCLIPAN